MVVGFKCNKKNNEPPPKVTKLSSLLMLTTDNKAPYSVAPTLQWSQLVAATLRRTIKLS